MSAGACGIRGDRNPTGPLWENQGGLGDAPRRWSVLRSHGAPTSTEGWPVAFRFELKADAARKLSPGRLEFAVALSGGRPFIESAYLVLPEQHSASITTVALDDDVLAIDYDAPTRRVWSCSVSGAN